jgi:hypothetical protein
MLYHPYGLYAAYIILQTLQTQDCLSITLPIQLLQPHPCQSYLSQHNTTIYCLALSSYLLGCILTATIVACQHRTIRVNRVNSIYTRNKLTYNLPIHGIKISSHTSRRVSTCRYTSGKVSYTAAATHYWTRVVGLTILVEDNAVSSRAWGYDTIAGWWADGVSDGGGGCVAG